MSEPLHRNRYIGACTYVGASLQCYTCDAIKLAQAVVEVWGKNCVPSEDHRHPGLRRVVELWPDFDNARNFLTLRSKYVLCFLKEAVDILQLHSCNEDKHIAKYWMTS